MAGQLMWETPVTRNNHQKLDFNYESRSTQHQRNFTATLAHRHHDGGNETGISKTEIRESSSSAESSLYADSKMQDDLNQRDDTIRVLKLERDQFEKTLGNTRRQLNNMRSDKDSLDRQVRDLSLQISEGNPQLKRQVATLTAENRQLQADVIAAHHEGMMDGIRTQCATNERVILIQQIEAYKSEAAKWKQEALGKGPDLLNMCWQASVDDGVRRKREADSLAIGMLREENAALRAEKRQ
jgi:hypothetical protein